MITYKKGCLLDALDNKEINYAIHCCNAQMVMGSGIALQVKTMFPKAYEAYLRSFMYDDGRETMLGDISSGSNIINLIGQENYGYDGERYINYGAIVRGFNEIIEEYGYDGVVFGIPYNFGCDRGGGDWNIMMELIEFCFEGYDVRIYRL